MVAVDPVTVAIGAGTALSGLIGSLFNASSADDANNINLQNFRESMAFQKYQYENLKRYNSLQNKASQARAAGLNPILAMEGVNSNMSAVSSPSANPIQPIDYTSAFSSAGELGNSLVGAALKPSTEASNYGNAASSTADAVGKNIDNETKGQFNVQGLKKLGYETQTAGFLADLQRETLGSSIRQSWLTTHRMELLNEYQGLLNDSQAITNGFLPTESWARIKNTLADTTLKLANKQIGYMQAQAAIKNAIAAERESFKSAGIRMTSYQSDKLARLYMDNVASQTFKNYSFEGQATPWTSKRRAQYDPHKKEWHEQHLSD